MTDQPELFDDIPPIKSTRLIWMEQHEITVTRKASSMGPSWTARWNWKIWRSFVSEEEAVKGLAINNGIKLWNQP